MALVGNGRQARSWGKMAEVQSLGIVPTTSMCASSVHPVAQAVPMPLWMPSRLPEPSARVRLVGQPVTALTTEEEAEGEQCRRVRLRPCTEDFDAV